jgi:hypothetical protein
LLTFNSYSQTKRIGNPGGDDIYGTWQSYDGNQILQMKYLDGKAPNEFVRYDGLGNYVSGNFYLEEKYIYVQKIDEKYRLLFYLKGLQLIVSKPDSEGGPGKAWIFTKVSNYVSF